MVVHYQCWYSMTIIFSATSNFSSFCSIVKYKIVAYVMTHAGVWRIVLSGVPDFHVSAHWNAQFCCNAILPWNPIYPTLGSLLMVVYSCVSEERAFSACWVPSKNVVQSACLCVRLWSLSNCFFVDGACQTVMRQESMGARYNKACWPVSITFTATRRVFINL
jgi:hypothetical protein